MSSIQDSRSTQRNGNCVEEIWIIFPPIRLRDDATSQTQTGNQMFAWYPRHFDLLEICFHRPGNGRETQRNIRISQRNGRLARRTVVDVERVHESHLLKPTRTRRQTFTNSSPSWRLEWNYASSFATGRGWSVCSAGVFSCVLACVVGKVCQSRLLQAFYLGLHTTLFALLRTSIHRYSVLYEPYAPCSMSSEQFRLSSETVFSWVLCHYTPCPRCSLLWRLPAS